MSIPASYRVSVQREGETITQSVVHAPVTVFYLNNLHRDGREYSVRVEPDRQYQTFPAKTGTYRNRWVAPGLLNCSVLYHGCTSAGGSHTNYIIQTIR